MRNDGGFFMVWALLIGAIFLLAFPIALAIAAIMWIAGAFTAGVSEVSDTPATAKASRKAPKLLEPKAAMMVCPSCVHMYDKGIGTCEVCDGELMTLREWQEQDDDWG